MEINFKEKGGWGGEVERRGGVSRSSKEDMIAQFQVAYLIKMRFFLIF